MNRLARALVLYMCASAIGAGLVLAVSTGAYAGAALQALPPAVAFVMIVGALSAERRRA